MAILKLLPYLLLYGTMNQAEIITCASWCDNAPSGNGYKIYIICRLFLFTLKSYSAKLMLLLISLYGAVNSKH